MPDSVAISEICSTLNAYAPLHLAEDWDNVGLLIGDQQKSVQHLMTCLTITPDVVQEAIDGKVDLIITHHPFPFRAIKQITSDTINGRMLLDLMKSEIAVYSPHTAFDSAAQGINQQLAVGLNLNGIQPMILKEELVVGSGRFGTVENQPTDFAMLVEQVKQFLNINSLQVAGDSLKPIKKVAIACGAAGEFLSKAIELECDCFITGETNFHTCLEARSADIALILTGHYASERFAIEKLANYLEKQFNALSIWASREESNPIRWIN